ncbi:MAG: hypothetical protein ABGX10_09895 [Paracoccus sp. (in: a-proteobacteria)]|uniref:hypothetical protein n=1 Tax=Paracoccus sp. TaxID=267 RepID=UPI0032423BCE
MPQVHHRARRKMGFARDGGQILPVVLDQVADEAQHPSPFVAMHPALPLVAQVVFVFLHAGHGSHQYFHNREGRTKQRNVGLE